MNLLSFNKKASNRLSSRIVDLLEQSTFDSQKLDFLPQQCLGDLVTLDTIKEELELENAPRAEAKWGLDEAGQRAFVEWIAEHAKAVFAITARREYDRDDMVRVMYQFQEKGFNDKRLPIPNPKMATAGLQPETWKTSFHPDFWNDARLHNFYRDQWMCLVPVFGPHQYNYNLTSECIFPFFLDESQAKRGAFGAVHKVSIHEAHQKYDGISDVAIKEINVKGDDKAGTDSAWELEARALEAINKLDHEHIVKCIGAIRRGDSRYFMFPWADGENLREFWEKLPQQTPSEGMISHTILQLRGLADGLHQLHDFNGGKSGDREITCDPEDRSPRISDNKNEVSDYNDAPNNDHIRHGDLKPDNILRFAKGTKGLGTLKIADMGLAKRHVVATGDRRDPTSQRFGTARYEAPETETTLEGGRSRLYDIWSMGCITLEFIIWNLYGNDALNVFHKQLNGELPQSSRFFEVLPNVVPGRAEVHTVVRTWMDHIQRTDPECSQDSAIRDLLRIVRTKLLVVPLPPNRKSSPNSTQPSEATLTGGRMLAPPGIGETRTYYRATAQEFCKALDDIIKKFHIPGYRFTGSARQRVKLPTTKMPTHLPVPSVGRIDGGRSVQMDVPFRQATAAFTGMALKYTLPPLRGWEFPVDNSFAEKVLAKIGPPNFRPHSPYSAKLCGRCRGLDFWAGGFAFDDTLPDLEARSNHCEFCKMLLLKCRKSTGPSSPKIRIERDQSTLKIAGGDPLPILSILRSPESNPPRAVQLGFPELPEPGTDSFFHIIKLWLEDCDTNPTRHISCHQINPTNLPTRLVNVGTRETPCLNLIETHEQNIENSKYIALSHPWGDPQIHTPYSTLRYDETGRGRTLENFKQTISYDELPATFKDAVSITRALGISYLWIDSLCIIQGKDGDFNEEAKRMEDVFSGAYCVIAASRATGPNDGFLGSRPQREYLTFQRRDEQPFYVCDPIDNFSRDVLEGHLNQRGWVLQERALARRTIYFTESQTYFECGNGVRCETLARMHNNMADFLGDPNFPDKAMREPSRAMKIRWFQSLYRDYSRLRFTRIEDRPIAISGLERRLQKAFGTTGGHGVFDDGPDGGLFHRSLLWRKGDDEGKLQSISFPSGRSKVPSWSWMAYEGGIEYADPDFSTADWEETEIRPPWTRGNAFSTETEEKDTPLSIPVTVRDFNVAGSKAEEVKLWYDSERTASDGQRPQCIVVAKSKYGRDVKDKRFWVLLVALTGSVTGRGEKLYRRVGAGIMMGKFIGFEKAGTPSKLY